MLLVLVVAIAKFGLHMIFNNRYGYFRDEFDYMACGDHLAWGYVDRPSLAPFLMRVSRELFGELRCGRCGCSLRWQVPRM